MTCPVCHVRRGPCVEDGAPIEQYHTARVRAESRRAVESNHAAEASRLRAAQKGAGK